MKRSILTATLFAALTMSACATIPNNGPGAGFAHGGAGGASFTESADALARVERTAVRRPEIQELPHLERLANRPGPCPKPHP